MLLNEHIDTALAKGKQVPMLDWKKHASRSVRHTMRTINKIDCKLDGHMSRTISHGSHSFTRQSIQWAHESLLNEDVAVSGGSVDIDDGHGQLAFGYRRLSLVIPR